MGDAFMVPIGVAHRAENRGRAAARAVFHLSPLAPSPELGHVDLEPLADPTAPDPGVGRTT
jgi:putative monooxygenase